MKKLSYILILAGIILLLTPTIREHYYDLKQDKLLRDAEQFVSPKSSSKQSPGSIKSEYERLSRLFNENTEEGTAVTEPIDTSITEMNDQAIAIITIDKIDLKLPVLEGATKQNMKVGAAHMTETAPLGEIGNAAIAAHRAHTKGRQFNRLNELAIGDEINIKMKDSTAVYTVYEILVVEPTDLSVLASNNNVDSVLTLITCDPLVNPTHRLIVHAKMTK